MNKSTWSLSSEGKFHFSRSRNSQLIPILSTQYRYYYSLLLLLLVKEVLCKSTDPYKKAQK